MSNTEEGKAAGTDAMAIMGTVAAAFGPVGTPLHLILVGLDAVMSGENADKIRDTAFDFSKVALMMKEENHIQDARNAWAKISPTCSDYFRWVRQKDLGSVARTNLDRFLNETLSPNSNLREGLLMIYNPHTASQIGVAKYAAQVYMLGASVHVAIRLLAAKRHAELHKDQHADYDEWMIAGEIEDHIMDVKRLATTYGTSIDRVASAAKHQIEVELRAELDKGMFQINTPELRERNVELTDTLLGGEDASLNTRMSLERTIAGADRFLKALEEYRTVEAD